MRVAGVSYLALARGTRHSRTVIVRHKSKVEELLDKALKGDVLLEVDEDCIGNSANLLHEVDTQLAQGLGRTL